MEDDQSDPIVRIINRDGRRVSTALGDLATATNGRFPPYSAGPGGDRERQVWGMKTSSRRQGRVAAVGSVRRPSPGRTGVSETRRLRPFARRRPAVSSRPTASFASVDS